MKDNIQNKWRIIRMTCHAIRTLMLQAPHEAIELGSSSIF